MRRWSSSKDSDETYGLPRPAPWPEAPPRWAAALAAYPQSWTCLDATRHVDSLRQERKKKGVLFFCYTPIIHGCLGQGPLLRSQSSWPQQKNSLLPTLTFHQGFYMGAWRTGRCWWLGRLGTHPHYPAAVAHVLGRTRMDPSFKEREREGGGDRSKKKDRKERADDPSFHTSLNTKGWSLEGGEGGGWGETQGSWKPDPEGYQRLEEHICSSGVVRVFPCFFYYFRLSGSLVQFQSDWFLGHFGRSSRWLSHCGLQLHLTLFWLTLFSKVFSWFSVAGCERTLHTRPCSASFRLCVLLCRRRLLLLPFPLCSLHQSEVALQLVILHVASENACVLFWLKNMYKCVSWTVNNCIGRHFDFAELCVCKWTTDTRNYKSWLLCFS